jgi:TonB-dependent starch-binding outer membrane protein SusC
MRKWIVATTIAVALAVAGVTAGSAQTPTGVVAGSVRDAQSGQVLEGTVVSVMGTNLTTTVSASGRYQFPNVPAGQATVRVQRIGYAVGEQTVTVTAGSTAVLDFQLVPEALQLQGVVVVGYGTQRRENVIGAVASVTSEDFVAGPARSAASLIAGKLPGLAVVTPNGRPGSDPEIQLRGITTIRGARSPLVLVDGVPGNLSTVPAEDIEAISVLKDGSAAAIYGSRASNGVILITTKRHAGGSATLRYDGYLSQSTLYRRPDFLSAADYRRLNAEKATTLPFEDFTHATDWIDALTRDPLSYRHNLTLSGGAANTNYTGSLNLENEQGIFQLSENTEFTARANIRHQMFDGKLETEGNVVMRRETEPIGPDYNYIWRQSLIRNPTDRILDGNSGWQVRDGYFYDNPMQLLNEVYGSSEERNTRLHGTVTFRPIPQLRFSLMGGSTWFSDLEGSARSLDHPASRVNGNQASRFTRSTQERILELSGTVNHQIAQHNFALLGGYTYTDNLNETFNASNTRFPGDLFEWNQLNLGDGMALGQANIGSGKASRRLIGFFSRLNYDWKDRYLLMASLRYEGDSRFGTEHKWGVFPGVQVGWRISEESFMQGLPFINELRLRAGYGVTGMAPDSSYLSLRSYSFGGNSNRFLYNGNWVRTLGPERNPNPDLKWEEKHETNIGVNFAAFDSRLSGSVDVYNRETRDMLYNYSVPVPPYVVGSILANVGNMRNSGVEAELSYDVIRRPGFTWTTSANWSRNKNRLVELSDSVAGFVTNQCFTPQGHTGEPIQQSTHRVCVGGPIGDFFGYQSVDIDEQGEFIVLNAAGVPIAIDTAKQADKRVLGNGFPKQFFAWNNTAQFGRFDLSVNLRGAAEFQILNLIRAYYENPRNTQYNMLKSAFDPVYGKRTLTGDLAYVSYYIEDGDYIKLDNATLGFTLPQSALNLLGGVARSARVYISGRNLLTITGYKGLDPEVSTRVTNDGLSPGIESRDAYPTIRTFTAGLTVSF